MESWRTYELQTPLFSKHYTTDKKKKNDRRELLSLPSRSQQTLEFAQKVPSERLTACPAFKKVGNLAMIFPPLYNKFLKQSQSSYASSMQSIKPSETSSRHRSITPHLAPGKLNPNPGTAGGVATATGSGLTTC